MSWRRRAISLAAAAFLAAVAIAAQPAPPQAQADPLCDIATGGPVGDIADSVAGGIGLGNPLGDTCDAVTGGIGDAVTAPLESAVEGIGDSVFGQLTTWVAEGASWLIGEVVVAIEKTTTPQLASKSFLSQYMKMAAIAAVMALAMLMLAVLEGIAQGNAGMLVRVALVNAPLAMIATTVAYAVVQLLLVVTDGLCAAISATSDNGSQRFFEEAIKGLGQAGGSVGKDVGESTGGPVGGVAGQAQGAVGVPLFVAFLAAIVGAFAAFFVWLELLMRDAAVYVVSLFLPLSLAASIWPRWTGALRRTAELLLAVIGSKFVIVAIVGLAAALVTGGDGGIEHVLAASALMLLACFAPFVLLKLIPFAAGAMTAAYARRSASGGAQSAMGMASDVAILRGMANARGEDSGVTLWGSDRGGGGGGGAKEGGSRGAGGSGGGGAGKAGAAGKAGGGGPKAGGAGGGPGAGGAAAGGAAAGAAVAVPIAAAKGAKGSADRLSQTGVAKAADAPDSPSRGSDSPRRSGASEAVSSPSKGERPPRPKETPPPRPPGRKSS